MNKMDLLKNIRNRYILGGCFILALFLVYKIMPSQLVSPFRMPQSRKEDASNKTTSQWNGELLNRHINFTRKTHIAYLKIPKTGSSTMACVFIRFGIRNNLNMFLPRLHRISDTVQNQLLARKLHYDIFAIHTHYNYHFFTNIVKNPVIISMVREPVKRIISHAFFFLRHMKQFRHLPAQDFINKIVADTGKYGARNIKSIYFGISKSVEKGKETLLRALHQLNSEFSLVLVLEKMDESLVLMKRLLNWSFADIVYARMKESHHPKVSLNSSQTELLLRTNKLDHELYKFFANELDKKIRNSGENFHEEVQYFRYVINEVNQFCLRPNETAMKCNFEASKWESGFSIYKHTCTMLRYDLPALKRDRYTDLKLSL